MLRSLLASLLLASVACGALHPRFDPPPLPKSILLIWLDDVAAMELALYGGPVSMPHLEALAEEGVTFTRMYGNANCAPTRRSAMTGKWWIRGTGAACAAPDAQTPPASDQWLPEVLSGHNSALIGKWHLGAAPSGAAWETAPFEHGFDYVVDMLPANVGQCSGSSYTSWTGTTGGATASLRSAYQPHVVRDVLVSAWDTVAFPRLGVVSANLAHAPIHVVPSPHTQPTSSEQRERWEKMLMAYDDLIGDMLAAVDLEHTVVCVVGDNGTYVNVAPQGEEDRAKGTVFERGVRVPCVIAGKGIVSKGRTSDELAHVVDLWPTLIEMAEGTLPLTYPVDGVSLKPILKDQTQTTHEMVLVGCNWGGTSGERGVVSTTKKLRQTDDDGDSILEAEELYDLAQDPSELTNVIGNPAYAADLLALRAFAISETP